VADAVLTVWDLPQGRDAGVRDAAMGAVAQAAMCASVELPCACDTVSFNPSNPGMVMCTAASHHHDGVGGGHAGGCFVFKLATSHGHTSLSIVTFDLASLPLPWEPKDDARAGDYGEEDGDEGASPDDGSSKDDRSATERPFNAITANGKDDDDDEDDEAKALKCVMCALFSTPACCSFVFVVVGCAALEPQGPCHARARAAVGGGCGMGSGGHGVRGDPRRGGGAL
jgi:hypothetical protein